jgi:hypothetical protein
MASRQFATFEVADQLFGVEVDTVQEVLSYNEYTPVPLAPPAVGGLFNLRGQVIAAVDLRVQLGLARQALHGPGHERDPARRTASRSACWSTGSARWWTWTTRRSSRRRTHSADRPGSWWWARSRWTAG